MREDRLARRANLSAGLTRGGALDAPASPLSRWDSPPGGSWGGGLSAATTSIVLVELRRVVLAVVRRDVSGPYITRCNGNRGEMNLSSQVVKRAIVT